MTQFDEIVVFSARGYDSDHGSILRYKIVFKEKRFQMESISFILCNPIFDIVVVF